MSITEYKIDSFSVEIYACDLKGKRTRWGEKLIRLFSQGQEVAQAVFARREVTPPEPYFSGGKIFYFASHDQYAAVMDLLRHEEHVFIAWEPVSDPKESNDGDAFFHTGHSA